jgi:hypothetical protein
MSSKAFWQEFNALFREMDKFFERMDRLFDEAKTVNPNAHVENPDEHKVRFRSKSWGERFRFAWQFFCMTVSMVFRGHATVSFRRRKPVK